MDLGLQAVLVLELGEELDVLLLGLLGRRALVRLLLPLPLHGLLL